MDLRKLGTLLCDAERWLGNPEPRNEHWYGIIATLRSIRGGAVPDGEWLSRTFCRLLLRERLQWIQLYGDQPVGGCDVSYPAPPCLTALSAAIHQLHLAFPELAYRSLLGRLRRAPLHSPLRLWLLWELASLGVPQLDDVLSSLDKDDIADTCLACEALARRVVPGELRSQVGPTPAAEDGSDHDPTAQLQAIRECHTRAEETRLAEHESATFVFCPGREEVARALASPNPWTHWQAVVELGWIFSPWAEQLLYDLIHHADPVVCAEAKVQSNRRRLRMKSQGLTTH